MKNLLSIPALGKAVLALLFVLTLASCGSSSSQDGPAPIDGSIVINPPTIDWEVALGACTFANPPVDFNDHLINITVFDARGNPLGDVDIDVTLELSGATASIFDTMFLFDDRNGNLILEASELVVGTNPATGPNLYRTKTDDLGNKVLWLRVDLGGCSYGASLRVVSGSVSQFLEIDVEAS